MWLLKRHLTFTEAGANLSHLALRLPRRLRDRVTRFGLTSLEGFDLEGVAFAFALAAIEVENSRLTASDRKRLRDEFALDFADKILRRRLTHNLYEIHHPLAAVAANQAMQGLPITSRERLELSDLQDFLVERLRIYRWKHLEGTIEQFLGYFEVSAGFDLKFADSGEAGRAFRMMSAT